MIFSTLRKLSTYERLNLPYVQSCEDKDIVFALMAAHEQGTNLNLKQLSLYRLGSPATLRRRLIRLQKLGVISKTAAPGDRRLAAYCITKEYLKHLQTYEKAARSIACQIAMGLCGLDSKGGVMGKPVIEEARDPDQFASRLRERCKRYGQVGSITISCSHENDGLFAMIEIEGKPALAASDFDGVLFGDNTVCVVLPRPEGFRCDTYKANNACMKVYR